MSTEKQPDNDHGKVNKRLVVQSSCRIEVKSSLPGHWSASKRHSTASQRPESCSKSELATLNSRFKYRTGGGDLTKRRNPILFLSHCTGHLGSFYFWPVKSSQLNQSSQGNWWAGQWPGWPNRYQRLREARARLAPNPSLFLFSQCNWLASISEAGRGQSTAPD